MSTVGLPYHVYLLRSVADFTRAPALASVALQPGVADVVRVTFHTPDPHTPDSVATVVRRTVGTPTLTRVWTGRAGPTPPQQDAVPLARVQALLAALRAARFDRLPDQPDLPTQDMELWLVERAAGSFVKGVVLAPRITVPAYAALHDAVLNHLPEAVAGPPGAAVSPL